MAADFIKFLNYLNNKNIAVVGSGASVLNKEYGEEIDSHDVVIRINRGYPYLPYRQYVGTRTDIWSFGMGAREDLRSKMNKLFSDRKYSMYCWYESSWVPLYLRNSDNHITLPPHFSRRCRELCGGVNATTGLDTVHFLITGTEFKGISLYGFDHYTTEYWFKELDDSITISSTTKQKGHVPTTEENIMRGWVESHCNIRWNR